MATIPELPLFTSGPLKSGTLNRLRDVVAFWQNPPAANMRASSSQNITTGGSYQLVTFHTTEYDTDTIVTSTTRLTAKTAGRYRVAATATFSANGTGDRYVLIRKNAAGSPTGGTQVISATAKPSSGSSCTVSTNSALEIQLSVNDTIEVFCFQDSGSTLTLNSQPGDTFVTMRLVSATATLSGTAATNILDLLGEVALGTSDLDTILQPGFYLQGTAADATLARHYPVATVAGHLQVYANGDASPASCTQIFETTANAVYVRHRATTTWSAWTQLGSGGGVTDHGALTGLADNDHPQYLLVTDAPETIRDTMGTALVAGSGVTITPNDGADTITVAGSALPLVWVFRSSDFSYSNNTLTTITWNAEAEDSSGFHDLVSNTDRLTVPTGQGGLYQVSFSFKLSGTSIGASAVIVQKNGGTILPDITSPVSGATAFSGSALLRLAAGDYLSLQIFTNAGTSLAITGGATQATGSASFVQLVRIGS